MRLCRKAWTGHSLLTPSTSSLVPGPGNSLNGLGSLNFSAYRYPSYNTHPIMPTNQSIDSFLDRERQGNKAQFKIQKSWQLLWWRPRTEPRFLKALYLVSLSPSGNSLHFSGVWVNTLFINTRTNLSIAINRSILLLPLARERKRKKESEEQGVIQNLKFRVKQKYGEGEDGTQLSKKLYLQSFATWSRE